MKKINDNDLKDYNTTIDKYLSSEEFRYLMGLVDKDINDAYEIGVEYLRKDAKDDLKLKEKIYEKLNMGNLSWTPKKNK